MSQRRSGPALFTPDPQSPIFAVSPRPTRAVAAAPIVVVVGLTCGRTLISPLASPPPFSLSPAPQGGPSTLSHRCQTSMQTADLCLLLSLSSYFSFSFFVSGYLQVLSQVQDRHQRRLQVRMLEQKDCNLEPAVSFLLLSLTLSVATQVEASRPWQSRNCHWAAQASRFNSSSC